MFSFGAKKEVIIKAVEIIHPSIHHKGKTDSGVQALIEHHVAYYYNPRVTTRKKKKTQTTTYTCFEN